MARGRAAKIKRSTRSASKSLSYIFQEYQNLVKSHDHDLSQFSEEDEMPCNHKNLSPEKMQKVARLLSRLFTTSYKLAVPSLFRGMILNLQDHFLMDRVISFLESGYEPALIKSLAKDESTRQGVTAQIRLACEEELAEIVLRLSTEDCFDLACDLSARHGRQLKADGPPCACSFSHCLGCLEKLVDGVCNTPPLPPAPILPVERSKLTQSLIEMLENEDSPFCHFWRLGHIKDEKWTKQCGDAWQDMADTLWEAANAIDPLKLSHIREACDTLSKLNGIDLWYTVVMRELQTNSSVKKKSALKAIQSTIGDQYDKWKNGKGKRIEGTEDELMLNKQVDMMGTRSRKALARGMRDQGNASFTKGLFQEASDFYTKAIGYDDEEVVFPLNRAACYIKLERFKEAEEDCNTAIELDETNHKAWFRRGSSRAAMGDIKSAALDFQNVLHLQKDNQASFDELRRNSLQVLSQNIMKPDNMAESIYQAKLDKLLPLREDLFPTSITIKNNFQEKKTFSKRGDLSVAEVFTQVSFAVAFSHVLKKQTGIDIKVPITSSVV